MKNCPNCNSSFKQTIRFRGNELLSWSCGTVAHNPDNIPLTTETCRKIATNNQLKNTQENASDCPKCGASLVPQNGDKNLLIKWECGTTKVLERECMGTKVPASFVFGHWCMYGQINKLEKEVKFWKNVSTKWMERCQTAESKITKMNKLANDALDLVRALS